MAGGVKRVLLGRALSTSKAEHQLLPKVLALPVFSSDPLSSVAYATEEMMLVLAIAGAGALALMLPIGFAIAALLAIVVTSYRQTVKAYPRGGGSYIVSKENLGTVPGLVAAGAILTDYVLTVSVSVTAGSIAVASAFPALAEHRVALAISFIALVTLANLRGVREAGTLFAVPTYGFAAMVGLTIVVGLVQCLTECHVADSATEELPMAASLSVFLILRAFSSGATALTGVEAIADGVQAFRRPQAKNAATTLAVMGAISISMFLGITFLARETGVRVSPFVVDHQSVLAQIGDAVFDGGLLFYVLQVFTAGILILAANTAFQDFPRLSAILARDRFMPSQFRNRGDRLVFSNGVLVLAAIAGLLVYVFHADLTRLIQLYVVGVFTAFTLSQSGMVRRWMRLRTEGLEEARRDQRHRGGDDGRRAHHRHAHEVHARRMDRHLHDPGPRLLLPLRPPPLHGGRPAAARSGADRRRSRLEHLRGPREGPRPGHGRGRSIPSRAAARAVDPPVRREIPPGSSRCRWRGPTSLPDSEGSSCWPAPRRISRGAFAPTSAASTADPTTS